MLIVLNVPPCANTENESDCKSFLGIQAFVVAYPEIPATTSTCVSPLANRSCQPQEPTLSSLPPHSRSSSPEKSIAGWAG